MRHYLPILNYHGIESRLGEYAYSDCERVYVCALEDFSKHLDHISDALYESLNLSQAQGWLRGEAVCAKPVMITFDDGHLSHYDHAAPELAKRKMKGLFFVSPGLVGKKDYMDWTQLRELSQRGFEIGAHGYHHVPLPPLKDDQLVTETMKAKKEIEDRLGIAIRSFSVPRGFFSPRVGRFIKDAGYDFLFTSHFGLNRKGAGPFYLKRMAVKSNTSFREFTSLLAGDLGGLAWKEDLKERTRQILGPDIYGFAAYVKAKLIK